MSVGFRGGEERLRKDLRKKSLEREREERFVRKTMK